MDPLAKAFVLRGITPLTQEDLEELIRPYFSYFYIVRSPNQPFSLSCYFGLNYGINRKYYREVVDQAFEAFLLETHSKAFEPLDHNGKIDAGPPPDRVLDYISRMTKGDPQYELVMVHPVQPFVKKSLMTKEQTISLQLNSYLMKNIKPFLTCYFQTPLTMVSFFTNMFTLPHVEKLSYFVQLDQDDAYRELMADCINRLIQKAVTEYTANGTWAEPELLIL